MFNLMISAGSESWNSSPYEMIRSRAAVEYTADEISERYKFFDAAVIEELKSFPTLFVTEKESAESRIGQITGIRVRQGSVVIDFEFDPALPPLPIGAIEALRRDIDLGKWELSRTHWAIKDEPLFEVLIGHGYVTRQELDASQWGSAPLLHAQDSSQSPAGEFNTTQVFIVHGHDEIAS